MFGSNSPSTWTLLLFTWGRGFCSWKSSPSSWRNSAGRRLDLRFLLASDFLRRCRRRSTMAIRVSSASWKKRRRRSTVASDDGLSVLSSASWKKRHQSLEHLETQVKQSHSLHLPSAREPGSNNRTVSLFRAASSHLLG